MKRDLASLASQSYDLIIIGGGVNGAACAWDATLRGLRVALVDQGDYGGRTSSQSFKIAHSGLRYLQHADFKRMRQSIYEGIVMRQNAPHLVRPQPFLMPLYGHGVKGRETVTIYMKLFDLLSLDKGWSKDPYRRIPSSKILSTAQTLEKFPDIKQDGLTGGAVWHEAIMNNTERLLLAYLHAAAGRGAQLANYAKVTELVQEGSDVVGVRVEDKLNGQSYTVRGSMVLNASGPWTLKTLADGSLKVLPQNVHLSKALSFITRPLTGDTALSFSAPPMYRDAAAVVDKGSSMHFALPWRGLSMVGSLHMACEDDPDQVTITDAEIDFYLEMLNTGYPAAKLTRKDIKHILWGMIPADEAGSAAPGKQYRLIDHEKEGGISGLISVVGVKWTTSRSVAAQAIDLVGEKLGRQDTSCQTAEVPLWGGDIELFNDFVSDTHQSLQSELPNHVIQQLIDTYGSEYKRVLAYGHGTPELLDELGNTGIIAAQVHFAVEEESARKLTDVVLRRTPLGSLTLPPQVAIERCADLMAQILGWSNEQKQAEIEELAAAYPHFLSGTEQLRRCPTH